MSRLEKLLDRIRPVLVCPTRRGGLAERGGELTCGLAVRRDGAFRFAGLSEEAQNADWLNAVKAATKHRMGRLYPLAMAVLAPVYGNSGPDAFLAMFCADAIAGLIKHPAAHSIASGFAIEATQPGGVPTR